MKTTWEELSEVVEQVRRAECDAEARKERQINGVVMLFKVLGVLVLSVCTIIPFVFLIYWLF